MQCEKTDSAVARAFKCFVYRAVVICTLAGVTACGGGGSGTARTPTPETPATPTPETPATPTPETPTTPTPETPTTPAPETPTMPAPETPTMPEIPITRPAPDVPGTRANAVVVAAGTTTNSSISSADDVDYFRLNLPRDRGNTVTIWTTGAANTALRLEDGEGRSIGRPRAVPSAAVARAAPRAASGGVSPLAVVANSGGAVSVTTELDEVYARVTGRDGSTGDYSFRNTVTPNLAPRVIGALPSRTLRAGASFTLDLATIFEDPDPPSDGRGLTFSTSISGGRVGPVSLGVQLTGSILNVTSPAALPAGEFSISITASDPFDVFTVRVLTVTVTAAPTPPTPPAGSDVADCVDVEGRRAEGNLCPIVDVEGWSYHARFTNRCTERVSIRYEWSQFSESSQRPSSGLTEALPGRTVSGSGTTCLSSSPTIRVCVSPASASNNRCFGSSAEAYYRTYSEFE